MNVGTIGVILMIIFVAVAGYMVTNEK